MATEMRIILYLQLMFIYNLKRQLKKVELSGYLATHVTYEE